MGLYINGVQQGSGESVGGYEKPETGIPSSDLDQSMLNGALYWGNDGSINVRALEGVEVRTGENTLEIVAIEDVAHELRDTLTTFLVPVASIQDVVDASYLEVNGTRFDIDTVLDEESGFVPVKCTHTGENLGAGTITLEAVTVIAGLTALRLTRLTDPATEAVSTGFIAHFRVTSADAVASSNTGVHAAITLGADTTLVETDITNPAVPRNIIVKGNASGIAGDVTITGTDYAGDEMSEEIALDEANAVEGSLAFKTVTSITVPAKTNETGDTVSVGWGDALGLPFKIEYDTVLKTYFDGLPEATAPTVTSSTKDYAGNTVKLNSALDGKIVDVYLIVEPEF